MPNKLRNIYLSSQQKQPFCFRFIEDQEEKKERLVDFFRKNISNKYEQQMKIRYFTFRFPGTMFTSVDSCSANASIFSSFSSTSSSPTDFYTTDTSSMDSRSVKSLLHALIKSSNLSISSFLSTTSVSYSRCGSTIFSQRRSRECQAGRTRSVTPSRG